MVKKLNNAFVKYHGNGNDFIIFDEEYQDHALNTHWFIEHAPKLCDRHFGIGADGIILLAQHDSRFKMVVINRDGSLAKNCGNGLRCAADHLLNRSEIAQSEVIIELAERTYRCWREGELINVFMGTCKVSQITDLKLASCDDALIGMADIGNEHLIILAAGPISSPQKVVEELRSSMPESQIVNIGMVYPHDEQFYSVVHERGVGFTNSCGSGACAAAAFIAYRMMAGSDVELSIIQPGGLIRVDLVQRSLGADHASFEVCQRGEAIRVFMGICQGLPSC